MHRFPQVPRAGASIIASARAQNDVPLTPKHLHLRQFKGSDKCESECSSTQLERRQVGLYRRSQATRRAAGLVRSRHRSEEHTSELQSLMRISYAVFCLKKKKRTT